MNKLRYSIIYAVIRPDISEQISIGLIFVDGSKVDIRYSNEKLRALHGLFSAKDSNFISRVVRSMSLKQSEYTVDTIDYLTRYSNNMISLSPLQSIDIKPTKQNKDKLYRSYVYAGA
jgi:hypothetical protein